MSQRGKTLLKGHALRGEGMGYDLLGHLSGYDRVKYTHGVCECGAISPPLPSNRARRQWHCRHKDSLR